jgi:hypothetical protein
MEAKDEDHEAFMEIPSPLFSYRSLRSPAYDQRLAGLSGHRGEYARHWEASWGGFSPLATVNPDGRRERAEQGGRRPL